MKTKEVDLEITGNDFRHGFPMTKEEIENNIKAMQEALKEIEEEE